MKWDIHFDMPNPFSTEDPIDCALTANVTRFQFLGDSSFRLDGVQITAPGPVTKIYCDDVTAWNVRGGYTCEMPGFQCSHGIQPLSCPDCGARPQEAA